MKMWKEMEELYLEHKVYSRHIFSSKCCSNCFCICFLVTGPKSEKKELAILQAIGASPNQIIRLVLLEILSIVFFSMILGVILEWDYLHLMTLTYLDSVPTIFRNR